MEAQHLREIIQKQKNEISFLKKEVERLKFKSEQLKSLSNIKVIDPIFLQPIKN